MTAKKPDYSRSAFPSSIDLIEKLPSWARKIVLALSIGWFVYAIAHYGLGYTLLRTIFSP